MKKGKASKRRKQQKKNELRKYTYLIFVKGNVQKAMNNSKNREKNQISINEEKKQKKNEE